MDPAACAVILLLGVFAAVLILRLLFLFSNRSFKNPPDDQYLRRIAEALQLTEYGKAEATPKF